MTMNNKNRLTALRLDDVNREILIRLSHDLNFNKSQIVRMAISLLHKLIMIDKKNGEILLRTKEGEKKLIFFS